MQVYAPPTKEVPDAPNDPFFKWGRIGKVFYTEKALSPKSAPMVANATGLWLPAQGLLRRGQRVDQGLRQVASEAARRQDEVAPARTPQLITIVVEVAHGRAHRQTRARVISRA